MHSRTMKLTLLWTVSLLLALICVGWLPFLSAIAKGNSTKDKSVIILAGKVYNSTTSTEPTIVMRGSQLSSSIDIRLQFRIKEFSQYENVFQTADHNDGMRFEIFSAPEKTIRSAIIYNNHGAVNVFRIDKNLEIDKTYLLELRTEKAGFISVYLNDEHIGYYRDELTVFSDFLLGRGFDSSRTFSGHVTLEYGKIILASPMEKTLAWIERIKIFRYTGYLFLLISVLALMKIGEFVFYENEELLTEYSGWKRLQIITNKVQKNKNSKYWDAISLRIRRIADHYFLILFKLQIIISLYAVAKYSWRIGDLINESSRLYYSYALYEWTNNIYRPFGGNILNYIVLCIFTGLYGLAIYAFINKKNIELLESASKKMRFFLICILLLSLILLAVRPLFGHNPSLRYLFVAIFPLLYIFVFTYKKNLSERWIFLSPKTLFQRIAHAELYPNNPRKELSLKQIFPLSSILKCWNILSPKTLIQRTAHPESYPNKRKAIHIKAILFLIFILNRSLILLTFVLLFFVSLEPVNNLIGPIYLLNEYDIPNETYLDGALVNNDVFLNNLQEDDPALRNVISDSVMIASGENSRMEPKRNIVMSTIFSNRITAGNVLPTKNDKSMAEKSAITSETMREFYLSNYYEYYYFSNLSRGQMNHIGHVLNPLNEYQLGKPIQDIYLQYGFGYTFLLKWTMELFGGMSIENYYKCYTYYVIYFVLFLLMVTALFKNSLYTVVAFAVLCCAYYSQEFIPFILAPGTIPAIHIFDVCIVFFLILYFRKSNLIYLTLSVLSAFAGIMINKQFGSILTVALTMSIFLYALENAEKKEKRRGLLIAGITIVLAALISRLTATGTMGETFPYFITGLFSWPASDKIISWTLLYISVSYLFFFLLKNCRHYLKYVYVMVSIYTQGLFVYFYWSGLSNHLPTVIPFLGLQLLLMAFISQNILFKDKEHLRTLLNAALSIVLVVLLVSIVHYSVIFYRQKAFFMNNFVKHAAYSWNFEKAKIVTTINPKPIQESISLIQQYSPHDKGIFILSKYDNLLPFLADRYSKMTFFEMTWHLLSEKESREAIEKIRAAEPEYLFFDTNLADDALYDPWSKLYYGTWWLEEERVSRFGRYRELQKVFESVSLGYSLVEKGALISVYHRNSRTSADK